MFRARPYPIGQGSRAGILFCERSSHADLLKVYQVFLDRRAYQVRDLTSATSNCRVKNEETAEVGTLGLQE
jgi:hypothetical protein